MSSISVMSCFSRGSALILILKRVDKEKSKFTTAFIVPRDKLKCANKTKKGVLSV